MGCGVGDWGGDVMAHGRGRTVKEGSHRVLGFGFWCQWLTLSLLDVSPSPRSAAARFPSDTPPLPPLPADMADRALRGSRASTASSSLCTHAHTSAKQPRAALVRCDWFQLRADCFRFLIPVWRIPSGVRPPGMREGQRSEFVRGFAEVWATCSSRTRG